MSQQVTLVDQTGTVTGSVDLASEVFESEVNVAVMHQALLRQLSNARQGTHSTKNRSQVQGGGRKPYKQKGTGRARQGSIRAPQYTGGGVAFGPTPHGHRQEMPRKQRRLALRGALTAKAQAQQLRVLDGFELERPRTKAVVELLSGVEAGRRVLIVLGSHNEALERSARNLPEVRVLLAGNLNVRDLVAAETVLLTRDALEHVTEVLV